MIIKESIDLLRAGVKGRLKKSNLDPGFSQQSLGQKNHYFFEFHVDKKRLFCRLFRAFSDALEVDLIG